NRFHAGQDASQRQLHRLVELAEAASVDLWRKLLVQLERTIGLLLDCRAELQIEAPLRQFDERTAAGIGVQQERVQHYVVSEPLRADVQLLEREDRRLHVAGDLEPVGILEQRTRQLGILQRDRARFTGFPGDAQRAEVQLIVTGVDRYRYRRVLRNGFQV